MKCSTRQSRSAECHSKSYSLTQLRGLLRKLPAAIAPRLPQNNDPPTPARTCRALHPMQKSPPCSVVILTRKHASCSARGGVLNSTRGSSSPTSACFPFPVLSKGGRSPAMCLLDPCEHPGPLPCNDNIRPSRVAACVVSPKGFYFRHR